MLAFILRRLLQSVAVLLTVGFVAFSLFRYVGDPINAMVGQDTPLRRTRGAARRSSGLNDPAPIQFARFIANAAHGNFGLSYRTSEPVGRPDPASACRPRSNSSFCAAALRAVRRRADGRLYRALSAAHWSSRAVAGDVAVRRVAADVPDRHPADPLSSPSPALAALVRARRVGADRLVDDQLPHLSGLQGADPARRSRSACSSSP